MLRLSNHIYIPAGKKIQPPPKHPARCCDSSWPAVVRRPTGSRTPRTIIGNTCRQTVWSTRPPRGVWVRWVAIPPKKSRNTRRLGVLGGTATYRSHYLRENTEHWGRFSSRLGYSTGHFPALLSTCSRRKKGKKSAIQVDNAYLAGPASKAVQLYDRCRDEHMVARHEVEHDGVADAFVDGLDVPHLVPPRDS